MFNPNEYPDLLVGLAQPDDSAVYRLTPERAVISTMDFFPPVVDDPYDFGAIAAANALSDVYAMGGRPLMAINLAAFPDGLDMSVFAEILRGGAEKVREAGAVLAGGHTVADKEPKYGLAITGEVHPDRIFTKGGAQVGDLLILTKPLGTGTITTALKRDSARAEHVAAAVEGMKQLNRLPSELAQQANLERSVVHAVTDITGYSLLGHAHEMAHLSHVTMRLHFESLLWYPGSWDYAAEDIFPGGMHRNREYYKQWVDLHRSLEFWQEYLLYDPQTSGGLLMAVTPDQAPDLLARLMQANEPAALIGSIEPGDGRILIE